MYVNEDEDTHTYGKLFNRDVLRIILRYVLAYKKYLFIALIFVLLIAGSNLLVPFLLRTLIDRYISKQGQVIDLVGQGTLLPVSGDRGVALREQLILAGAAKRPHDQRTQVAARFSTAEQGEQCLSFRLDTLPVALRRPGWRSS